MILRYCFGYFELARAMFRPKMMAMPRDVHVQLLKPVTIDTCYHLVRYNLGLNISGTTWV